MVGSHADIQGGEPAVTPMLIYIVKRLALMIPTLLGILIISFAVIQLVPGGPVEQTLSVLDQQQQGMASQGIYRVTSIPEAERAALTQLYGLDRPVVERFWIMTKGFLTGDLGTSFFAQQSVTSLLLERLPVSLTLGAWVFLFTYLIAIPLGIAKAIRHGSSFDLLSTMVLILVYAIPGFVLGVALLMHFGSPSAGTLLMPVICIAAANLGFTTLLTKNSLLEEMGKRYAMAARARGLSPKQVMRRHLFRNAVLPVVMGLPTAFMGAFFTGAVLIETLFSIDGLGLLGFEAVMRRDYPVVMGTLFCFSLIGLLARLLTDLAMVMIDPRIAFEKNAPSRS